MENTSSITNGRPLTVAVVGAGKRVEAYTKQALERPDWLKVVAVVDPNPVRRNAMADLHHVPTENRLASHKDLAARPGLADAVINATGDAMHYESTLPLIQAGYHVLLEKPIALYEQHIRDLIAAAKEHQRVVMICHGMRYNPFYQKAKELLQAGAIGRLRSLYAAEFVSFYHLSTTFIRSGRYNGFEPTPMLMQKCCHDMDMIAWLVGEPAKRVASFLTPTRFVPANAPAGSTDRCLNDCKVEAACPFSARKMYVIDSVWDEYPWPTNVFGSAPTLERKVQSLKTDNPYGRCVWHCPEHTAVDHQNVLIEFAGGTTATFDMFCGAVRGYRTLHLVGAEGEIHGDADAGVLKLRLHGPESAAYAEQAFHLKFKEGGHHGADSTLLEDFVAVVRGQSGAKGTTRIENSLAGHQIVFAADRAMREGRVVEIGA